MKRRNFITASLWSLPVLSFAGLMPGISAKKTANPKLDELKKGFIIKANESRFFGKTNSAENLHGRCVISSADTDSQLYISSGSKLTNKQVGGPGLHIHYLGDEIFFVASGEFLFQIEDEIFLGKEGDTVFVPRGVPHTFANPVAENPGNLLIIHQPISESLEKFYEVFCSIGYMNEKMLQEKFEPAVLQDIMKNNAFTGPPINVKEAMKKLK